MQPVTARAMFYLDPCNLVVAKIRRSIIVQLLVGGAGGSNMVSL